MNRREVYQKIGIPLGYHFLYLGVECVIDRDGYVLCKEYETRNWRRPYYSRFQIDELLQHRSNIKALLPAFWHEAPCDSIAVILMLSKARSKE